MSETALDPFGGLYDSLVARLRPDLAEQPLPRRFLSRAALAEHLGVPERTIRTWRSKGMPGCRVGKEVMYDLPAVEQWIEAHEG